MDAIRAAKRQWSQLAHAKARDAVHDALDIRSFPRLNPILLKSLARDRITYLRRPDLGRRLDPESADRYAHVVISEQARKADLLPVERRKAKA